MRTSKPIAAISYNSPGFLRVRLEELISSHKISDWLFIVHRAESDERKDHIHLWIKPNTLIDTMSLQEFFRELDPNNPLKPLGCLDFNFSKIDDFILYGLHHKEYLASKGQSREYHYQASDFVRHDDDTFDDMFIHALKGSEWASRSRILEDLRLGVSPAEMVFSGRVPLQLAGSLLALEKLERGGRVSHTPLVDDDGVISD